MKAKLQAKVVGILLRLIRVFETQPLPRSGARSGGNGHVKGDTSTVIVYREGLLPVLYQHVGRVHADESAVYLGHYAEPLNRIARVESYPRYGGRVVTTPTIWG